MAAVFHVQIDDPGLIAGSLRAIERNAAKSIGRSFFSEMGRNIVNRAKYFAPLRVGSTRKIKGRSPGALRAGIRMTKPVYRNGEIIMTVMAPLSIIQHEDMTLKHTVGGPKFLEKAVVEGVEQWGPLILRAIKAAAEDPAAAADYADAVGGGFVGMRRAVEAVEGMGGAGEDWR